MLRLAPSSIADLIRHRELLWQFTWRNIELRHKGSYLGIFWSVLNPLLMLAIYVLVFGYIFSGTFGRPNETRLEYGLGIFLGLTFFHFLSEVISIAPTVVVGNPNFVKKVVFPLEILPAASVGAAFVHFLIGMILVLIGVLCFGEGLSLSALWLPVILFPMVLLALGLTWLLASLGVFLRDIAQVMQALSQVLMFSSAVFYPLSRIPESVWIFLRFNPVLIGINLARETLLWHSTINTTHLAYLYFSGIATCYLGHAVFRRLKPAFADVL